MHDDGRIEHGHLAKVQRDGLGDSSLLGFDARVGRRRVDEHHGRTFELLGELEDAKRFPISLGPRVAEVPIDLLLGVAALLMADHGDGLVVKEREAGDDRGVVAEPPVAVELRELGEQPIDVVQRRRPVRMPRDLHALPGLESGENLGAKRMRSRVQLRDRGQTLGRLRQHPQRLDLLEQDENRLLEVQRLARAGTALHLRTTVPVPQTASTSFTNPSDGRIRRAVAARTRNPPVPPFRFTTTDTRRSP